MLIRRIFFNSDRHLSPTGNTAERQGQPQKHNSLIIMIFQ